MTFNVDADDDDVSDLMEPVENQEIKNGQWLGVTVRSQGNGGKVRILALVYFAILRLKFS